MAKAMASVVSVLPEWPGRPPDAEAPEGSGVVVGDGQWIVTAAHVLEGARHVLVRDADGNVIPLAPGNTFFQVVPLGFTGLTAR